MKDSFWYLIFLIISFLPMIFGIRNLVIHKNLNDKKLTDKTTAYLENYEHRKNVETRHRLIPYLTSLKYVYSVDGKNYNLGLRIESKPSSKNLKHSLQVIYLKGNPKYSYCELTRFYYAIFGWVLVITGIALIAILTLAFILSL